MRKGNNLIKIPLLVLLLIALLAAACGGAQPKRLSAEEIASIQATVSQQQAEFDAQLEQVMEMDVKELEQSARQQQEPPRIQHKIIPEQPVPVEQTLEDSLSYISADENRAISGDNYAENLFERPFTTGDMVFQPWLDIQRAGISRDETFLYFTIEVYGVDQESLMLKGAYGIELDTDKDGRGDYLVMAIFPNMIRWNVLRVVVLEDGNEDVGGPSPMNSDAPWDKGDGYETRLFLGGKSGPDPDAAWVRVHPKAENMVQFAVKRELVGDPDEFLWSAWADNGLKAPGIFDYNDKIKKVDAGSPINTDEDYPLKLVRSVDNTCRKAYGFTADASIPGVCTGTEPTREPSTERDPQPDNPTHGDDQPGGIIKDWTQPQ